MIQYFCSIYADKKFRQFIYTHIVYTRINSYPHIHYMRIKPTCLICEHYFSASILYQKVQPPPPMGGFFLAPLEDYGPSGPKMVLPDGRTDRRTTGLRELDIFYISKCEECTQFIYTEGQSSCMPYAHPMHPYACPMHAPYTLFSLDTTRECFIKNVYILLPKSFILPCTKLYDSFRQNQFI